MDKLNPESHRTISTPIFKYAVNKLNLHDRNGEMGLYSSLKGLLFDYFEKE